MPTRNPGGNCGRGWRESPAWCNRWRSCGGRQCAGHRQDMTEAMAGDGEHQTPSPQRGALAGAGLFCSQRLRPACWQPASHSCPTRWRSSPRCGWPGNSSRQLHHLMPVCTNGPNQWPGRPIWLASAKRQWRRLASGFHRNSAGITPAIISATDATGLATGHQNGGVGIALTGALASRKRGARGLSRLAPSRLGGGLAPAKTVAAAVTPRQKGAVLGSASGTCGGQP